MEVTPAILARNADDLFERLFLSELKGERLFHLDVLDGSMFGARCFAEPGVIGQWEGLPQFELHLMVDNPLGVIGEWEMQQGLAGKVTRVIVHAEVARPMTPVLTRVRRLGIKTVFAVNPETPVDVACEYETMVDELLVMGVHPGASGQVFLGEEILAKVRRARQLFPALPVAVDGGVNAENIMSICNAGAQRGVVSSAVWQTPHPGQALEELRECAMIDKN